jgi:hypothetical protein
MSFDKYAKQAELIWQVRVLGSPFENGKTEGELEIPENKSSSWQGLGAHLENGKSR